MSKERIEDSKRFELANIYIEQFAPTDPNFDFSELDSEYNAFLAGLDKGYEYANQQPYTPKFKYKFTFKDEQGLELVVYESTETKAFRKAFRTYEVPKDRELTIVKKEETLKQY